jgi:hypothetical protein
MPESSAALPFRLAPVQRLADHALMAEMEAVEIAQRQNRATQRIRHGFTMIEAYHLGALQRDEGMGGHFP